MNRRRSSKTVFSIAVVLALVASTRAPALSQPSLSLAPAAGPAGTAVTVTGTNFERHCPVDVFVGSTANDPLASGVPVSQSGTFSTTITIPSDLEAGEHEIIARGVAKRKNRNCLRPTPTQASATYTVEEPEFQQYDHNIYLAQRTLEDPGIDEGFLREIRATGEPVYGIVQLHTLPKPGDLDRLRETGIQLLDYLNGIDADGTAYIASIPPGVPTGSDEFTELVSGLQRLEALDKVSPTLDLSARSLNVLITFFKDVGQDRAGGTLGEAGVDARSFGDGRSYLASITPDQVTALSASGLVQWIGEAPTAPLPLAEERAILGVDEVQQFSSLGIPGHPALTYYGGLSGEGVRVAMFDTGLDKDHEDFAGRSIRDDVPGTTASLGYQRHGTAATGIVAGSGYQSDKNDDDGNPNGGGPFRWRGIAPNAELVNYRGLGDIARMKEAYETYGADLSYSFDGDDYGRYDGMARAMDEVTAESGRPAVTAAFNNGSVGPLDCDPSKPGDDGFFPQYPTAPAGQCPKGFQAGYFSVLRPCKNCITAGNVGDMAVHSAGSSMGPTLDGRLKPDVVAVGEDVIAPRAFSNGYLNFGGTSAASPAVTGVVALLLQQHRKTIENDDDLWPFLPSSAKAVLVQTAIDLAGTDQTINYDTGQPVTYHEGPDFATGYGLVDAEAAIRLIQERGYLVNEINESAPSRAHNIVVSPGQKELRLTLAWDDPPASLSQNVAARTLVNDLDLTLRAPDGNLYRPLVLPTLRPRDCDKTGRGVQVGTCPGQDDPLQDYDGPAVPAIDRRNNVEQIVVKDPIPGTWRSRVSAFTGDRGLKLPGTPENTAGTPVDDVRLAMGGSQQYTLVTGQVARSAELRIDVSDAPDPVAAGEDVAYNVAVDNDGPSRAVGVHVLDTLSAGTTLVGADGEILVNRDGSKKCTVDGNKLDCQLGTIPAGDKRSFTITVKTAKDLVYGSSGPVSLTNHAEVFTPIPDTDGGDNTATDITTVLSKADLVNYLSFAGGTITELKIGQPATVTFDNIVGNEGPSGPVDATLTIAASATNGAILLPYDDARAIDALGYPEYRVLSGQVTIICVTPGSTVLTIDTAVQPTPPSVDPDASNDTSAATHTFVCSQNPL
jgi:uncharacterized repeat protein (TIGR01451 family)